MMSWIWRSPPPIENPWGGSDSGVLWYLIKRAGDSFWCDPISYQIEFTFAQSPIRLNWLRVTQSPIKLKSYGTQSPIKLIGETLSMYMYMYQRKASNLLSNWRVRVPNLLSNVIDLGSIPYQSPINDVLNMEIPSPDRSPPISLTPPNPQNSPKTPPNPFLNHWIWSYPPR